MMRRIFLISILLLLVSASYASQYSHVVVNGVDFEIPSQYSGGTQKNDKYVYNTLNEFGILCVDDYIISNYGGYYGITDIHEKMTIGNRPCMFLSGYNSYAKYNVSYLYFPVNESVYCICYNGSEVTPEISHIVESSPKSSMSSTVFYGLLDESLKSHDLREYIDQASEDNSVYTSHSNQYNGNNRHDDFVKWYLLTRMR